MSSTIARPNTSSRWRCNSLRPVTWWSPQWGWDEPALAQILVADPQPAYVSLISSKTKWRVIRQRPAERGIDGARLDRVRAPAGLDLGAETPGEIAVALIAEMLAVRRKVGAAVA